MVGEIRDSETASIAINAALTGHLVLSTIHTNSAVGAIPRLMDMGVEPFLLVSTLRLVVGQRLTRRLTDTKEAYTLDATERGKVASEDHFEAAFSAVPSIVCVEKPRIDTLIPGQTGLTVPARDAPALADAIASFADNRGEVRRMGANAQALAVANFVPRTNAAKLLALYQRVLGQA